MDFTKLERMEAYEVVEKRFIEDLNSTGIQMRHKKTGAKIALLSNDDMNTRFSFCVTKEKSTFSTIKVFILTFEFRKGKIPFMLS